MPHSELNSQQLKTLTNSEILGHAKALTEAERKITAQVLRLLREIERRRIFSALGFSSVHEFCVKFLKYSEGAAYRRISAMRLLRDLPQEEAQKIESSIEQGSLSLSSVSLTHSFFQAEKNKNAKTYTPTEKKEILKTLEGKSKRETERILMGISPRALTQEKERVLTNDKTQIQFVANTELLEKFKKIQQLASHTLTRRGGDHKSYEVLFEYMADLVLNRIAPEKKSKGENIDLSIKLKAEKIDPEKKIKMDKTAPEQRCKTAKALEPIEKSPLNEVVTSPERPEKRKSRYVPVAIRQTLWQRAQGQCEYIHAESGRRCETKSHLEVDHRNPHCLGGRTALNNLRVLCSSHNKTAAIQILGQKKMQLYLPTLR